MKKCILLFVLILLGLSNIKVKAQNCISCVLANQVDLSSDVGWVAYGQPTPYWSLVSGPASEGPYPRCGTYFNPPDIGGNTGNVAPSHAGLCTGTPLNSTYKFERKFKVCQNKDNPGTCSIDLALTGFRFKYGTFLNH